MNAVHDQHAHTSGRNVVHFIMSHGYVSSSSSHHPPSHSLHKGSSFVGSYPQSDSRISLITFGSTFGSMNRSFLGGSFSHDNFLGGNPFTTTTFDPSNLGVVLGPSGQTEGEPSGQIVISIPPTHPLLPLRLSITTVTVGNRRGVCSSAFCITELALVV